MLVYLDTSAFVPVFLEEPSSRLCREVFTKADALASSVLIQVESLAALGRARRMGRLTTGQLRRLVTVAGELLEQVSLVTATPALCAGAGRLALEHDLRGYDAVHLSVARSLTRVDPAHRPGSDVLFASGDTALLRAARALGLGTVDTRA